MQLDFKAKEVASSLEEIIHDFVGIAEILLFLVSVEEFPKALHLFRFGLDKRFELSNAASAAKVTAAGSVSISPVSKKPTHGSKDQPAGSCQRC